MSDKPKKKSLKKSDTKSSIKKSETKSSKKGKELKKKEKKLKSKGSVSNSPDNKTTSSKIEIDENKLKENLSGNNNEQLQNNINNINNNNINNINKNNIEKCEGCFQGEGYFYCTNCNKIYCKICDDQLHIIPSFRNHERILIENFNNLNMKCYHHNLPLKFFCESCQEPICLNCKTFGPHNNPLHHVGSIFEIYRKYLDNCKNQIEKNLIGKNEKIENILLNIDSLSKENKNTANIILKGINNEFDTAKNIIKKEEGKKLAILNYNSSIIQKEILQIENILNDLGEVDNNKINNPYYSNKEDPLEFLLKYKNTIKIIDKIISKKNINTLTNEDLNKLNIWPKELNESKKQLEEYPKIKKLLKVKDDIMFNLITIPYEENSEELKLIKEKAEKEISEWVKLSDQYAIELKKYNLVCSYCGIYLDGNKVNDDCPYNNDINYIHTGLTNEIPPKENYGNKRHFFGEPVSNFSEIVKIVQERRKIEEELRLKKLLEEKNNMNNNINETINEEVKEEIKEEEVKNPFEKNILSSVLKEKKKKKEENKRYYKQIITNDWVYKLAGAIEKFKINLYQVLSEVDGDYDGIITFEELLQAFYKMGIYLTKGDKTGLLKYLNLSEYKDGKIDIIKFTRNFMKEIGKEEQFNMEMKRIEKRKTLNRSSSKNKNKDNKNNSLNNSLIKSNDNEINTQINIKVTQDGKEIKPDVNINNSSNFNSLKNSNNINNESLKKSSDGFDEYRNKVKEDKKENEEFPLPKNVDLDALGENFNKKSNEKEDGNSEFKWIL